MTSMELLDLLGGIDDRFYDEVLCDPDKPLKISVAKQPFSLKRFLLSIAACLALLIGAGAAVSYLKNRPVYISDISVEARKLYLEEYPELERYENTELAVKSRVMDINLDGTDEVFVTTATGEAPPQIYSEIKTESGSGVEKTGELELTTYGTKLTDPEQLFLYDEGGEKYWYYSYLCYTDENRAHSQVLLHAAARINYGGGEYFTDFPFGYGTFDPSITDRRYGKDLEFSLSDGETFVDGDVTLQDDAAEKFEEISQSELEALWEKHSGLSEIINDFYEEYPELRSGTIIPGAENPFDGSAIPQARVAMLHCGEYEVWLIAENVHARANYTEGYFFSTNMKVALVKDGRIVSKENIVLDNDYTSVETGKYIQFYVVSSKTNYFSLYELKDTAIVAFVDKYGFENNFFAVRDGKIILLKGMTADGEISHNVHAGTDLLIMGNSLIDRYDDRIYSFDPDNFDKDPNAAPHFTVQAYNSDDPAGSIGIDKYLRYDPDTDEIIPQALLAETRCGEYTVKLLGHNVQTIRQGEPRITYTNLIVSVETSGGESFGTVIITDYPTDLNPNRLDEGLVPFEMKDGIAIGVCAYYNNSFARLYSIKDNSLIALSNPNDLINAGKLHPVYEINLTEGYEVDHENDSIELGTGQSFVVDFSSDIFFEKNSFPMIKGGKVFPTGTNPTYGVSSVAVGTQTEWDRWKNIVDSGRIYKIDKSIPSMPIELEISDYVAADIAELFSKAKMHLCDEAAAPSADCSDYVYAYDEDGELLFYVVYDSDLFEVCFADDTTGYVFGKKGGILEMLDRLSY